MDNNFIFQFLGDDPENVKNINQTLFDIQRSTFNELLAAQRALCGVRKYTKNFSDGEYYRNVRYVFDVPYTFIGSGKRIDHRYSDFYKKEIPVDAIYMRPDLFDFVPIVFVDGRLYDNFYVVAMEDYTQIRFGVYSGRRSDFTDGFTLPEITNFISSDTKITIVFMPLYKYTAGSLSYNTLTSGRFELTDDGFISSSNIANGTSPFIFVAGDTDNTTVKGYTVVSTTLTDSTCMFSKAQLPQMTNKKSKHSVYSLYFANNFRKYYVGNSDIPTVTVDVPDSASGPVRCRDIFAGADGWFSLPLGDMPCPVDSILVFRYYSDAPAVYDHDATITLHYPNVYKIDSVADDNDGYIVMAFYNDNISPYKIKLRDELSLYRMFCARIDNSGMASTFADGTVSDYVSTYNPIETNYGIDDYNSGDTAGQPLAYKLETLRNLIYNDPMLYARYLERFVDTIPTYKTIATKEYITDKTRTNTSKDIPSMNTVTFDSPMVVFGVDRFDFSDGVIVIADNKVSTPDHTYITDDTIYVYIDKSNITVGSTIEFYLLTDYTYAKEYILHSGEAVKITLPEFNNVRPEDIYLTTLVGGVSTAVSDYTLCEKIDSNLREILPTDVKISNDYYRPIDNNYFIKYPELYIISGDSLDGVTVTVRTDKFNEVVSATGSAEDYTINRSINSGKRSFMVYRDGRLMSPAASHLSVNVNNDGPHRFRSNVFMDPDTEFSVWHSSEKYNLVAEYHNEDINVKRLRFYQRYLDVEDDEIDGRGGNIYDNQLSSSASSTVANITSLVTNFYYVRNTLPAGKYTIAYSRHDAAVYVNVDLLEGSWIALDDMNSTVMIHYVTPNVEYTSSLELTDDISDSVPITNYAIRAKYVDMTGVLTKPIDFRWYDIYLNGLKLTERDVMILSPYTLLVLVEDDYPDIDCLIYVDLVDFILEWVVPNDELGRDGLDLINPDWEQITPAMVEDYPELMDDNTNLFLNPDMAENIRANIILDPDSEEGYIFPTGE